MITDEIHLLYHFKKHHYPPINLFGEGADGYVQIRTWEDDGYVDAGVDDHRHWQLGPTRNRNVQPPGSV